MLWEGDFVFLRYRYVDLHAGDGAGARRGRADPRRRRGSEAQGRARRSCRRAPASSTCRTSTARSTSSTSARSSTCRREVDREYRSDLRQNVVAILLDIFEQQSATAVRDEVVELLDVLMLHMLSAAQFQNVGVPAARVAVDARARARRSRRRTRSGCAQIPMRLSAPEALAQLLQSMDEAETLPPTADLLQLFEQLRGPALATVLEWIAKLQNAEAAPAARGRRGATRRRRTRRSWCKLIGSPDARGRARGDPARRRAARRRPPSRRWRKVLADGDVPAARRGGAGARRDRLARRVAVARARRSTTPSATCASRPSARSRRAAYRPVLREARRRS